MGFWTWLKTWRAGQPEPADPSQADQVAELCVVLREIIAVLEADGDTHWRDWIANSLHQLEANDLRGASHLLAAYGGRGSFNDRVIGQQMVDDKMSWAEGASAANDELDGLRSRAYGLADELKRNPVQN